MNRQSYITLMAAASLFLGCTAGVSRADEGTDLLISKANESVNAAESAVEEARAAIKNSKNLLALIPADSEFIDEVKQMIVAASENWKTALEALDGAKKSADKISAASSSELAQDYALLASVNAGVALSGAKVVQTGLLFVDAVANNKTEALDVVRVAMQDSLAASSQVQFNYDRVKALIADKYSESGQEQTAGIAAARGILADIAVIATQAKANLAAAAVGGDLAAVADASKRADAIDSAMAEGLEAFAAIENAADNSSNDEALAALEAARKKADDALNGAVPEAMPKSQQDVWKEGKTNTGGGPGGAYDPPNIYDVPWQSDGLRSVYSAMFNINNTASGGSSANINSYGDGDATKP